MPFDLTLADLPRAVGVMGVLMFSLLVATVAVKAWPRLRTQGALQSQVTSWWYLLPPVVAAWAAYPLGAVGLVILISALAARELLAWADPASAGRLKWQFAVLGLLPLVAYFNELTLWMSAWLLAISAWQLKAWHGGQRPRGALLTALFAIQAAGLWCLPELSSATGEGPHQAADKFFYLCTVTALNDIGQFIIGTCFGRHKLASRISPHKTWQGLGGGMVASVLVSAAVGRALGLASWPWLLGMGVLLSGVGLAGDLLFSAGKRAMKIKDYSDLIPGHGGILDRVDSLVLTAPLMLIALRLS